MDISGMDAASAKEYVVAVLATLKQTVAKRIELTTELEKWQERVRLAGEHGREDLAGEAVAKAEQVKEDILRIQLEEKELKKELDIVKGQLEWIKRQPQLSIDADFLLAQLQMVVGEQDELADKFKDAEAENELERLKKEMGLDEEV